MTPTDTRPVDLPTILALLQEYTKTLREVCQRELDRSRIFKRRPTRDEQELASTLARLTERASQYSEHAGKRLADGAKFEMDLKVTEAEAVFQTYQSVFKTTRPGA
jgi:hypothetical protein